MSIQIVLIRLKNHKNTNTKNQEILIYECDLHPRTFECVRIFNRRVGVKNNINYF